jgi:hypothetical protein
MNYIANCTLPVSTPDLTQLSHAQKNEVDGILWRQVQDLTAQLLVMQERIHLEWPDTEDDGVAAMGRCWCSLRNYTNYVFSA